MRKGRKWIPVLLILLVALACVAFLALYRESRYSVETLPQTSESLDSWTPEESVSNGQPLKEEKSVYQGTGGVKANYLYLTIFPTKDDSGETLDFSAFDLHTSRNKDYNPVLDANVLFGNSEGTLDSSRNSDAVNASIRVRGNSSRGEKFKSFKIKFKEDTQVFEGQTILNVNKHVSDISKVTNKFCMDLMAPLEDLASFRTNFMIVYIRDASLPKEEQEYKYYGLYTHVEQPNKNYLKVRGLDSNGSLYKATNFEFRLTPELKNVDDPAYDEAAFETVLNIREGNDHARLLQMLTDINDMNQDFEQVFSTYFNEENYLTWMACNVLLGNEDTIAHNFILYNPKDSMTWYLLPWDYDGTFKIGEYASSYLAPLELKGIQRMSGVVLHRRYFRQPGNIEKLTAKMEELLATSFTRERVDGLLSSYLPVVEQALLQEPDLTLCEIPPNEYTQYLASFHDQIMENYRIYVETLKYPMPVFVSAPVVKEDGSLLLAWEPSHDFNGDRVSYGIRVAEDIQMQKLLFEEQGITDNTYVYKPGLPDGVYYLAVTVTDEQGNTQYSLDSCDRPGTGMYFGIQEFRIQREEVNH